MLDTSCCVSKRYCQVAKYYTCIQQILPSLYTLLNAITFWSIRILEFFNIELQILLKSCLVINIWNKKNISYIAIIFHRFYLLKSNNGFWWCIIYSLNNVPLWAICIYAWMYIYFRYKWTDEKHYMYI